MTIHGDIGPCSRRRLRHYRARIEPLTALLAATQGRALFNPEEMRLSLRRRDESLLALPLALSALLESPHAPSRHTVDVPPGSSRLH